MTATRKAIRKHRRRTFVGRQADYDDAIDVEASASLVKKGAPTKGEGRVSDSRLGATISPPPVEFEISHP